MKVRDVMTRTVATVGPESSLAEAATKMRVEDRASLPVVREPLLPLAGLT